MCWSLLPFWPSCNRVVSIRDGFPALLKILFNKSEHDMNANILHFFVIFPAQLNAIIIFCRFRCCHASTNVLLIIIFAKFKLTSSCMVIWRWLNLFFSIQRIGYNSFHVFDSISYDSKTKYVTINVAFCVICVATNVGYCCSPYFLLWHL